MLREQPAHCVEVSARQAKSGAPSAVCRLGKWWVEVEAMPSPIVTHSCWRLVRGIAMLCQHSCGILPSSTMSICSRCTHQSVEVLWQVVSNLRLRPLLRAWNGVLRWKQCHPLLPAAVETLVGVWQWYESTEMTSCQH